MKSNRDSLTDGLPVKPANEKPDCGPGCDCGSPSGSGRAKLAVSLVVLLAVAVVVAYKVINKDANNAVAGREEAEGFTTTAAAAQNAAAGKEPAIQGRGEMDNTALTAKGDTGIGEYLDSMSVLNKVALGQDAVFIFVPAKKDEVIGETTRTGVLSAKQTLASKNIKVGLYTLKTAAPDYSAIASQVQLPAILVACKGRGMEVVSGKVTETKLLQAFMTSSQAGGCCSSAGGSSACR